MCCILVPNRLYCICVMQLCEMNVVYEEKKNTLQYENNKIIFFIFLYKINYK